MSASNMTHIASFMTGCKGKKVKCTLIQALRLCTGRTTHRGSKGITLLFLDHGTRKGEGSASRPGCSLTPGKDSVPIVQKAGWAPGPVWTGAEKSRPPPGFDPRTVQPVASRYADWATGPTWQYVDLRQVNGWLRDAVSSATHDRILIGWLKAIRSHCVSDIVIKTNLQSVTYNLYSS